MGRFKNVEIKGLLIEKFEEIFESGFTNALKIAELSKKETLEKVAPHFEKILADYEDNISSLYLDKHKFSLNDYLKAHFNTQQNIAEANKEPFISFILYVHACEEIYNKIIQKLKRKRIDFTLKINVALYGLIIRRAKEIVNLFLSGYIDGSMIIWRSLYENAITLLILAHENDNELANKFYQHSLKSSQKKVLSYNLNYKELGFPPLPNSTKVNLKSQSDKIRDTYGTNFLENDYGWADSLFGGKQRANFRLLEEKIKMNIYRPHYLLCCDHIHSSFNSFNNFMKGNKVIIPRLLLQRRELKSFIDPMQFTVSILQEINEYILYEFSVEAEYKVNLLLFEKIFKKQQNTFRAKRKKTSH